VQSASVQHVFIPMQTFTPPFPEHSFSPGAHWHVLPTAVQVSPWNLQSAFVQQVPAGMQAFADTHKLSPAGHTQLPPGLEQTEPVGREQSASLQH
jgi:hypothetical protein